MKIKKVFSSLMALGLMTTIAACGGGENNDQADTNDNQGQEVETEGEETTEGEMPEEGEEGGESVEDFDIQTSDDTLVVGVEEINGDFIGGWTNNKTDVRARKYMGIEGNNSYSTVVQDETGQWVNNMTVLEKEPETVVNEDGSETTTFTIKKDLKFSDGEPITAKHYLFGPLLETHNSYQVVTGSTSIGFDTLKGYEDYFNGDKDFIEGLEYVDDYTFKATVSSDFLPYYEVESLRSYGPFPVHAVSENLTVSEDGKKIVVKDGYEVTEEDKERYIKNLDTSIQKAKEDFEEDWSFIDTADDVTDSEKEEYEQAKAEHEEKIKDLEAKKDGDVDPTELLMEDAMLRQANEYRVKPTVVQGPYKFDSFKNNMVKLSLNEHYAGNFKGEKATIPNVILQTVNKNIAVDLLENGDIDIWEAEVDGAKIDQMRAAAEEGKIGGYNTFERNGYGNVTFLTDRGTTKYKEVRQAIAQLMDRNSFVQSYAGGYGVVTNGMYGTSQWMYKERGADLETDPDFKKYQLNLDAANDLLDATPFKFESDGQTPWDKAKADEEFSKNPDGFDYYRYDENGEKLQVNQYGSDESPITTLISNQVPVNAKQVGMEYNVTSGSFATLLEYYNFPKEDAEYTAFNMGTSFGTPFDPYYQYHSKGFDNKTKTNDPVADELTVKLRQTDPDDMEAYLDTWEEFEMWYNDYLPEIPLYANQNHTGYSKRVKGFDINTPLWESESQINAMTIEN